MVSAALPVVKLLMKSVPTPSLPTMPFPAKSVTLRERVTLTEESGKKLHEGVKVATVLPGFKAISPGTKTPLSITVIVEALIVTGLIGSEKANTMGVLIGTWIVPFAGLTAPVGDTVSADPPVVKELLKF